MRTTDHDPDQPRPVAHGVPGGTSRLPRLRSSAPTSGDAREREGDDRAAIARGKRPAVQVVEGGFIDDEVSRARRSREERETRTDDDGPVYLSFADYSPTESLFAQPRGRATENGEAPMSSIDVDDSFTAVLGVAPDADWNTIRRAHRQLLTRLHPDRFVTADEATRQDAADQLAAINIAYHELEKGRRAV